MCGGKWSAGFSPGLGCSVAEATQLEETSTRKRQIGLFITALPMDSFSAAAVNHAGNVEHAGA